MNLAPSELEIAWSYVTKGRFDAAKASAANLLRSQPDNISAMVCHAMACWKLGDPIEGPLATMARVVALAPQDSTIRHNYANILASIGDMDGATAQYEAAMSIRPDDTLAFYGWTQNRRFRERETLVESMERLGQEGGLDAQKQEFLHFGLAKVYADLGEDERAFGHAVAANRLGARPFDVEREDRALARLIELADKDSFRAVRHSGCPDARPLFVVGMNRSGTTLVESVLSRHPAVLSLGERVDMARIEGQALASRGSGLDGRHDAMLAMSRDWIRARVDEQVLIFNRQAGPGVRVITDKLPENALRLGLVARLFPRARIIHVRRHPLDVGVSNFFQRFSHGQGYSTRLGWIGRRTRQIADAMQAWKRSLDLDILDVSYERLVSDPASETRRIVAFAGLDWNDDCLDPSLTPRGVLTASQWQVRQPISTRSVERWRRYEPWLGPMIQSMGGMDWIEAEMADIQGRVASRSNSKP